MKIQENFKENFKNKETRFYLFMNVQTYFEQTFESHKSDQIYFMIF